jgi:plastocyanin domain-containing protein
MKLAIIAVALSVAAFAGCGKEKIEKTLPLNTPVEVAATFAKAGKLAYACGMDMVHGSITVQ